MRILSLVLSVDTPYDYSTFVGSLGTILGGVTVGLSAAAVAALAVVAVKWGIPMLVGFFKRVAGR